MTSAEQAPDEHPTPDQDAAVDFLSAWPGDRAWVYTFTEGRTHTELYEGNGLRALADHLRSRGDRNTYFAINPLREPLRKKAKLEEVGALVAAHVDLDPPRLRHHR